MKTRVLYISLVISSLLFLNFYYQKSPKIDGVWSIVEVKTVKPDGSSSRVFPKESQAIFAKKHYSFLWTTQVNKSRNWAMSDSLKLDRFNQSIVNSGTFEIKDSVLNSGISEIKSFGKSGSGKYL